MEENDVRVNHADAVFIPGDIDGSYSDYTEYKVSLYRTVPENCYLVSVNNFTGKIVNKGEGGFKFTIPWITKSILVPSIDRVIDYPSAKYLTLDNIMANIDIALNVKIVNPVLYIRSGRYQLKQLNLLTQSLLRVYIQRLDFTSISKGVCPLDEFDPELEFEKFEKTYGIRINKVLLQDVKLPVELQKQYDDAVEAQKRREKQRIDLEAKKDEALAKKEIAKMEADSYLMKYENLIAYLKQQNISDDAIAYLIKTQMISESPNAAFFVGDSDLGKNIGMGIASADNYTRSRKK